MRDDPDVDVGFCGDGRLDPLRFVDVSDGDDQTLMLVVELGSGPTTRELKRGTDGHTLETVGSQLPLGGRAGVETVCLREERNGVLRRRSPLRDDLLEER